MMIVINGSLVHTEGHNVIMVFKDDKERLSVAKHLTDMPKKKGPRAYGIFTGEVTKEDMEGQMNTAVGLSGYSGANMPLNTNQEGSAPGPMAGVGKD